MTKKKLSDKIDTVKNWINFLKGNDELWKNSELDPHYLDRLEKEMDEYILLKTEISVMKENLRIKKEELRDKADDLSEGAARGRKVLKRKAKENRKKKSVTLKIKPGKKVKVKKSPVKPA